MPIRPIGTELFQADGRADRRTDMVNRTAVLRSCFAKIPMRRYKTTHQNANVEPRTLFADALVPACMSFLERKPLSFLSCTHIKTAHTHNQIQQEENLDTI